MTEMPLVMPLAQRPTTGFDRDGAVVTRTTGSVHMLSVFKDFTYNDTSVNHRKVLEVLGAVCEACPVTAGCLPEFVEPQGFFSMDPLQIRGAGVHTTDCLLADACIPDGEFRK